MPRYTGINHLAMVTGDMDATIRFWRDLLGMRLAVVRRTSGCFFPGRGWCSPTTGRHRVGDSGRMPS